PCLGLSFFRRCLRCKALGHELAGAILFASQELEASASGLDAVFTTCLGLRQSQGGLFNTVFELAQDLTLGDDVPAVDVQAGNDPYNWTGEFHRLVRLDHAIELGAVLVLIRLGEDSQDGHAEDQGEAQCYTAPPDGVRTNRHFASLGPDRLFMQAGQLRMPLEYRQNPRHGEGRVRKANDADPTIREYLSFTIFFPSHATYDG